MDNETLLDLIAAQLSLEEILDLLGWETSDLVQEIKSDILKNKDTFLEALV